MADITSYPLVRHLRATPTVHVRHLRRGKLVNDGTGLAFFFRPLSAVLSEIPVDDRELPMLFHARTADFHDMTVQASVTFRITDPAVASARLDFSIDPATGRWRGTPLEQLAGLLAETAQQQVLGLIAASPLLELLGGGIGEIRDRILGGLTTDARLAETGIAVIGARVVALKPEPEVEKAPQTPAREALQQEADRATYERRAVAVESERAIAENELANQIELARREEQLVAQRGANARRQAEEAAGANRRRRRRRPGARSCSRKPGRTPPARSARRRQRPRQRCCPPTATCPMACCSESRSGNSPPTCRRSAASPLRLTCSPAWHRRS